jgi:hypothetical protein
MTSDEFPELEQCRGIIEKLRESAVASLFITYDPNRPDFPKRFFDANPNIPSLSFLESKLLGGGYKSSKEFHDEVVSVFDTFLAYFQDDTTQNGRAWEMGADHVKSKFLKYFHAASPAGKRAAREVARRECRALLENPLGGRFEQTTTMETAPAQHDMLRKVNPRNYY